MEKKFTCHFCGKGITTRTVLKRHVDNCKQNPDQSRRTTSRINGKNQKRLERNHLCVFCDQGLTSAFKQMLHEKKCKLNPDRKPRVYKKKPFRCVYCKEYLLLETGLELHLTRCRKKPGNPEYVGRTVELQSSYFGDSE
jgi:hypothetical protein